MSKSELLALKPKMLQQVEVNWRLHLEGFLTEEMKAISIHDFLTIHNGSFEKFNMSLSKSRSKKKALPKGAISKKKPATKVKTVESRSTRSRAPTATPDVSSAKQLRRITFQHNKEDIEILLPNNSDEVEQEGIESLDSLDKVALIRLKETLRLAQEKTDALLASFGL